MIKIRKICVFLIFCICALGQDGISENPAQERDIKVGALLHHYYSGHVAQAKDAASELRALYPFDPFFHELMAEVIWLELQQKTETHNGRGPKDKKVDYDLVKKNYHLAEEFYSEVYDGLVLTQSALDKNPRDARNMFLRGMLLCRLGGFMAKFENGLSSYAKADENTADGIVLLRKSFELDPNLCVVQYVFALTKYMLIKTANEAFWNSWIIKYKSKVFDVLGADYNQEDVFKWIRSAMACQSDYYYAKDVMIDRQIAYQEIMIKQAGRYDHEIKPVLENLARMFPDNETFRNNLFLVRMHLRNNNNKNNK